jgi:uncharacterized coiled-coil DUF342 family protein
MISGDAATRILLEVMRGKLEDATDNEDEKAYRKEIKAEIDEIHDQGGTVQLPKDWP